MRLSLTTPALSVSAGAKYRATTKLLDRLTLQDRFDSDEEILLYRWADAGESPKFIEVPRALAPTPVGKADQRVTGATVQFTSHFVPRDVEQVRIVEEASPLILAGESFIIRAGTGRGKTVIGSHLASLVGVQTAIIVHKSDLVRQWRKALTMVLGLDPSEIGLIKGDSCDYKGKKVVICFVQSVCKRGRYPDAAFKGFGMVIFDEVHRMGAEEFSKAIWNFPAKIRLGLSATTNRKDGRSEVFTSHIGPVAVVSDAIPMKPKVLVRFTGWEVPKRRTHVGLGSYVMKKIPIRPGRMGNVFKVMATSLERNIHIADGVVAAYHKGRNILVLADTKAHLECLYDMINGRGIPESDMAYFVGGLSDAKQDAALQARVVLGTYKMTAEGTDAPWLDFLILATPKADIIQIGGRVLREFEGKPQPVIVDLVDSDTIFLNYAAARKDWYRSIGADIVVMD